VCPIQGGSSGNDGARGGLAGTELEGERKDKLEIKCDERKERVGEKDREINENKCKT
jgi:hypothetical protein